jgi:hypothetical protein
MAVQKIGKIWLGNGDLTGTPYSEISAGSAAPNPIDGSDGDVYVRVAGANSNFFVKRSGAWEPMVEVAVTATLPDNTSNFVWLTLVAAAAQFLKIEYGISRGANFRSGEMSVLNDLVTAGVSEYGVQNLGAGDVGVDLDAQVSGSNLQLLATTDSQGISASLKYFIRSWS